MQLIVYNPNFVHPEEVSRLTADLDKRHVSYYVICHMSKYEKPLYIQYVNHGDTPEETKQV
jgi:hypothetical protein